MSALSTPTAVDAVIHTLDLFRGPTLTEDNNVNDTRCERAQLVCENAPECCVRAAKALKKLAVCLCLLHCAYRARLPSASLPGKAVRKEPMCWGGR